MLKRTLLLAAIAALSSIAQTQKPAEQQEAVFKVDTTVFQIDAVVTDKSGRVVTDLEARDFEIVEKKTARAVEYCSFLPLTGIPVGALAADGRLRPDQLQRTFVFVISNPYISLDPRITARNPSATAQMLGATGRASLDAANLIEHFVKNRMQPGDLVEIIKVDQNTGVLAQLTNDRKALLDAITKIRNNPLVMGARGVELRLKPMFSRMETALDVTDIMQQNLGAVRVVSAATDQIQKLPGRKVVVLAAQFMLPNHPRVPEGQIVASRVAQAVERANKAGVTVHAMSLAGMSSGGLVPNSTDALFRFASETGGALVENTHDFEGGLGRILELNRGYYLLGYRLADGAPVPEKVTVRVKRPGLKVHARTAGLGPGAVAAAMNKPLASEAEMADALASPLSLQDIPVSVEPSPIEAAPRGAKAHLHYDLKIDLSTVQIGLCETGKQGFSLEIVTALLGPTGEYVELDAKTHHYEIAPGREDSFRTVLTKQYDFDLEKPGDYQLRVLVRDTRSNRAGTAAQFLNAPAPPKRG